LAFRDLLKIFLVKKKDWRDSRAWSVAKQFEPVPQVHDFFFKKK
jgi:hypothetical protein